MLIKFSVENFKVFKDKATLSMLAHKSYKELPQTTYVNEHFSDTPLLNAAVIYGANGAGKSSLIAALAFFKNLINQGFTDQSKDINYQPFLFDDVLSNAPSHFSISFIGHDSIRYHYGLSLTNQRVIDEYLLSFSKKGVRAKTIFSRVYDHAKERYDHYHPALTETKKTIDVIIDKLDKSPKTTFLRALCQYNSIQIQPVVNWMTSSIFVVPFNKDESFVNLTKSNIIMMMLDRLRGADYKKNMLELLSHFSLSVTDLKIVKRDKELPEYLSAAVEAQMYADTGYEIQLYHQTASGRAWPVFYDDLSSGTKKLLHLCSFLYLCKVSSRKTVVVFDEIESSFHPHIVKKLYQILVKDFNHHIQLIVTTHSPIMLDTQLIRRDQIWFIEKNTDLASELYALADFSPAMHDNFAKNWLQGRYGGVPG